MKKTILVKVFVAISLFVLSTTTIFAFNIFSDLSESHDNYNAIFYLKDKGIINGYPDGTFKPEFEINRAEFLKILVEGSGVSPSVDSYSDCFSDVETDWYAPYVCYANSIGWIDGYPDGSFKPAQTVNKVEAIKMILNSQDIDIPSTISLDPFNDVQKDTWFAPFVAVAREMEILEETNGYLYPAGNMIRAGVCENLYRTLKLLEKNPDYAYEGKYISVPKITDELISLDDEWNIYKNYEQGYSMKIPKKIQIHNCVEVEGGWECEDTPIKIIKDGNSSFIAHEYVYSYDGEKIFINTISEAREEGRGWEVVSKYVANEGELLSFVQEEYGETCTLNQIEEDGYVVIHGTGPEGGCFLNYAFFISYNAGDAKAYSVKIGQDPGFAGHDPGDIDYASLMTQSFSFL